MKNGIVNNNLNAIYLLSGVVMNNLRFNTIWCAVGIRLCVSLLVTF